MAQAARLTLVAYYRGHRPTIQIVPAPRWRDWMNETEGRSANRCLPLLVANEAGWFLLNDRRFTAEWNGGRTREDLDVRYEGVRPRHPATANFGHGILTFTIPYVFRTGPGFELLARGPANMPRDGIAPLDGLVETDWSHSTFTMNWKFTRPGTVTFEEDDAICMVVPQRRHDLEAFAPEVRSVEDGDPGLAAGWEAFSARRLDSKRQKFLALHTTRDPKVLDAWEAEYFRGTMADGRKFPDHVTKRRLSPFQEPPEHQPDDEAQTG